MTRLQELTEAISVAVRGKPELVERVVICLLAEGHLLIEDNPGLGKTTAARALAAAIGGEAKRIQFTPDLLPSDVTGVNILNQTTNEFTFRPGGIFANIVIADEINRASPKTQSALLEVMGERQVTVDGTTYPLARPFMVVATQNPVDMDGTYRLPEAQLDRFLMKTSVDYPDHDTEVEIITGAQADQTLETIAPVMSPSEVQEATTAVRSIYVAPALAHYVVALVEATRPGPDRADAQLVEDVQIGASPRGGISLLRAAQASAALAGRTFVIPEDVIRLAGPVLAHRIILTPGAEMRGVRATDVVAGIVDRVRSPAEGSEPSGR